MQNLVKPVKRVVRSIGHNYDLILFAGIIVVLNTHILKGEFDASRIFFPEAVMAGEWLRVVTHPFVHVGWYHLFLDAGAFFLLYTGLEEKRKYLKVLFLSICGAGSIIASLIATPRIHVQGLCGLSGIGHGLMAITSLEMMQKKETRWIGLISLLMVTLKSIYELLTGNVLFHFGLCGSPLSACHIGGVIGGCVCYIIFGKIRYQLRPTTVNSLSGAQNMLTDV